MTTSPNQNVVTINLQEIQKGSKEPYLHILRGTMEKAVKDLGTISAVAVYLYLASNKNFFTLGFSPKAINQVYGISEDSARNGFKKLIEKRYLVETSNNHYDFYLVPRSKIQALNQHKGKKLFVDDDGEQFEFTFEELLKEIGDKEQAQHLWDEAQEV